MSKFLLMALKRCISIFAALSFLGFCSFLLMTKTAYANNPLDQNLAEMLQNMETQQDFWRSRQQNLREVEKYLMRFYHPQNPVHKYMRDLFLDNGLEAYNGFIYHPTPVTEFSEVAGMHSRQAWLGVDHIQSYLDHLPQIELVSYQAYQLPIAYFSSFREGFGLYEQAFMQSIGSLNTVMQHFDRSILAEGYQAMIMEIHGKTGRMLAHLHPSQEPIVLFPKGSYFHIQSMYWDESNQAWLARITEVTPDEARHLPEVHKFYDNERVQFNCD